MQKIQEGADKAAEQIVPQADKAADTVNKVCSHCITNSNDDSSMIWGLLLRPSMHIVLPAQHRSSMPVCASHQHAFQSCALHHSMFVCHAQQVATSMDLISKALSNFHDYQPPLHMASTMLQARTPEAIKHLT